MADQARGVPHFARDLVRRGLDALAQMVTDSGQSAPGTATKLAKMWTALSDEERLQASAGIVAVATAAAMAIPMTLAAVKKRARGKGSDEEKKKKKKKRN